MMIAFAKACQLVYLDFVLCDSRDSSKLGLADEPMFDHHIVASRLFASVPSLRLVALDILKPERDGYDYWLKITQAGSTEDTELRKLSREEFEAHTTCEGMDSAGFCLGFFD